MNQRYYEAAQAVLLHTAFRLETGMVVLSRIGEGGIPPIFRSSQWERGVVFCDGPHTFIATEAGTQQPDAFPLLPDLTHPATQGILLALALGTSRPLAIAAAFMAVT